MRIGERLQSILAVERGRFFDDLLSFLDENSDGKIVKEPSDGRRFEVRVSEAGEESVVQELSRR